MAARWSNPLATMKVTSKFDPARLHPVTHTVTAHNGTDYRAPVGTALFAAATGEVIESFFNELGGNIVRIRVDTGVWIGYHHLLERKVARGDTVDVGDVIGLSGGTGKFVKGPHLHFEVSVDGVKRDPVPFLTERLTGGAVIASALVVEDEENEMRDDERNLLFHIAALLEQTPGRTAQQVWAQPVSRVEGRPTTMLQDTVDGTTAALSTTVELAAMTAAVRALAAAQGLDTEAVTEAARAGARAALARSPKVQIDEEELALALAHLLPGLTGVMPDAQVDELTEALTGERGRRGRG